MRYHRKVGTLKSCFKHDGHGNLDMGKSIIAIQLIKLHIIGLNSLIIAKEFYQEFVGNSDLVFQNNSLNYKYITKVAEEILPNSLLYTLSNIDGSHNQQIHWMI